MRREDRRMKAEEMKVREGRKSEIESKEGIV